MREGMDRSLVVALQNDCNRLCDWKKLKVKERKEVLAQITDGLNDKRVCLCLTNQQLPHKDPGHAWTTVIELLLDASIQEFEATLESIQKRAVNPKTQKSASNHATCYVKLEVFPCLKLALRKSSNNHKKEYSLQLIQWATDAIYRTDAIPIYGRDMCVWLSKDILTDDTMTVYLKRPDWMSLLNAIFSLISMEAQKGPWPDVKTLLSMLQHCLERACVQTTLPIAQLVEKLAVLSSQCTHASGASASICEFLCSAFLTLTRHFGADFRFALIRLGDRIWSILIGKQCGFDFYSSNNHSQRKSLSFMLAHFLLHHPNDATSEAEGAVFSETWKLEVQDAFKELIAALRSVARRIKPKQSFRENTLASLVCELCSRMLVQFFWWNDFSFSFMDDAGVCLNSSFKLSQPPKKRSKGQLLSWHTLVEFIDQEAKGGVTIWLELLEYYFFYLGDRISENDLLSCTRSLAELFPVLKNPDVINCTLKVVWVALSSIHIIPDLACTENICAKLWTQSLKFLMLSQCKIEAFRVLTALLPRLSPKLIDLRTMFDCVNNALVPCSQDACLFLLNFLHHSEFSERQAFNYATAIFLRTTDQKVVPEAFSFRCSIMSWLFEFTSADLHLYGQATFTETFRALPGEAATVSPSLAAYLCYCLISKCPSKLPLPTFSAFLPAKETDGQPFLLKSVESASLERVEEILKETLFQPYLGHSSSCISITRKLVSDNSLIRPVVSFVVDQLISPGLIRLFKAAKQGAVDFASLLAHWQFLLTLLTCSSALEMTENSSWSNKLRSDFKELDKHLASLVGTCESNQIALIDALSQLILLWEELNIQLSSQFFGEWLIPFVGDIFLSKEFSLPVTAHGDVVTPARRYDREEESLFSMTSPVKVSSPTSSRSAVAKRRLDLSNGVDDSVSSDGFAIEATSPLPPVTPQHVAKTNVLAANNGEESRRKQRAKAANILIGVRNLTAAEEVVSEQFLAEIIRKFTEDHHQRLSDAPLLIDFSRKILTNDHKVRVSTGLFEILFGLLREMLNDCVANDQQQYVAVLSVFERIPPLSCFSEVSDLFMNKCAVFWALPGRYSFQWSIVARCALARVMTNLLRLHCDAISSFEVQPNRRLLLEAVRFCTVRGSPSANYALIPQLCCLERNHSDVRGKEIIAVLLAAFDECFAKQSASDNLQADDENTNLESAYVRVLLTLLCEPTLRCHAYMLVWHLVKRCLSHPRTLIVFEWGLTWFRLNNAYASRLSAAFEENLFFVLVCWHELRKTEFDWPDFPFALFGCNAFKDFAIKFRAVSVSAFLLAGDYQAVRSVADTAEVTLEELLHDVYPQLLATLSPTASCLLKTSQLSPSANDAVTWLHKTISDPKQSLHDAFVDCVFELFRGCAPNDSLTEEEVAYHGKLKEINLHRILTDFAHVAFEKDSLSEALQVSVSDRVQRLQLKWRPYLLDCFDTRSALRSFKLMTDYYVDVCKADAAAAVFIVRDVVVLLVNLLRSERYSNEVEAQAQMLNIVAEFLSNVDFSNVSIMPVLNALIHFCCDKLSTPPEKTNSVLLRDCCTKLLQVIFLNPYVDGNVAAFVRLSLLPQDDAELKVYRDEQMAWRTNADMNCFADEVRWFCSLAAVDDSFVTPEYLRYLACLWRSSAGITDTSASSNVVKFMTILLQLLSNESLRTSAADLLALLYPTFIVEFSDYVEASFVDETTESLELLVLKLLDKGLCSNNVEVFACASDALKMLFAQNESDVRKTYDCHKLSFPCFQPFVNPEKIPCIAPAADLVVDWNLEHAIKLHSTCSLESWSLRILEFFVGAQLITAQLFVDLLPFCKLEQGACVRLLPFAFRNICYEKYNDEQTMSVISRGLRTFVHGSLTAWTDAEQSDVLKSAAKLIFHCLTMIRKDFQQNGKLETATDETLVMIELRHANLLHAINARQKQLAERRNNLFLNAAIAAENAEFLYGLSDDVLAKPKSRLFLLKASKDWAKAINLYSSLSLSDEEQRSECAHVLQTLGLQADLSDGCRDYRFECAWKLSDWSSIEAPQILSTDRELIQQNDFSIQKSLLSAFSSIFEDDTTHCGYVAESMRIPILARLSAACKSSTFVNRLCSSKSALPWLSYLAISSELASLTQVNWTQHAELSNFTERHLRTLPAPLQFCSRRDIDDFICARQTMAYWLLQKTGGQEVSVFAFINLVHQRIAFARENRLFCSVDKCVTAAGRCLHAVSEHYAKTINGLMTEKAKALWECGEQHTALSLLKSVIDDFAVNDVKTHGLTTHKINYCSALLTYGNWRIESSAEFVNKIHSEYHGEAVGILRALINDPKHQERVETILGDARLTLARNADDQYKTMDTYMKSPEFVNRQSNLTKFNQQMHGAKPPSHRNSPQDTKAISAFIKTAQRDSRLEEKERESRERLRSEYLMTAIENYLEALAISSSNDLVVFRLLDLWFANIHDVKICETIKDYVERIPSKKWVCVWNQLTSRLGSLETQDFKKLLDSIILRVCQQHLNQTFYTIYALAHGDSKNQLTDGSRVKAANSILWKLKKSSVASSAADFEALADALSDFADYQPQTSGKIPSKQKLAKFRLAVPVPILSEPESSAVKPVYVTGFDDKFEIASGKSRPLVVFCRCSDGKKRRILIKGGEDLRQDAILQQVFRIVNELLKHSKANAKSRCGPCVGLIRVYNVIPLSTAKGLIEWCDGTMSLGEYLVGPSLSGGAHARYNPLDHAPVQVQRMLAPLVGADAIPASDGAKLNKYKAVCDRFRPVFRHFFYERFVDSSVWLSRRLAYTASVAVNSMIGHMLGIGDRHLSNILIDNSTGELIHIDLGIAFEQARVLPIPELVPFRLTRDVMDPMGVTGVEGVFRRSCEQVVTILRESTNIILPVISTLMNDPLSSWTISTEKIHKLQPLSKGTDSLTTQPSTTDVGQMFAERVFLRVKDKLNGREEFDSLSIKGQVSYLINNARDPGKLSRMFIGWSATA